jgi:hypothetical protein
MLIHQTTSVRDHKGSFILASADMLAVGIQDCCTCVELEHVTR